jgi:hypothetical protein
MLSQELIDLILSYPDSYSEKELSSTIYAETGKLISSDVIRMVRGSNTRAHNCDIDDGTSCTECCEHGDMDGGQCLDCGQDRTEDMMAAAYDRSKYGGEGQ